MFFFFFFNINFRQSSRARNLIESKRTVSWAEIINGGPLPQNPYLTYEPHDSFDERGVLKPAAYEANDQVPKKIALTEEELERRRLQVR